MRIINDFFDRFRKPIIIACITIVVLLIILVVYAKVIYPKIHTSDAPIVSIEATNSKLYDSQEEIVPEDFKVVAMHSDDVTTVLSPEEYELSRTTIEPVGAVTKVEIVYTEDPDIKCETEVYTEREKIIGFQCGYPKVKDVIAVLYSNGELCFEGSGDTLVFNEGEYPWIDYEEVDTYPIRYVSFQPDVKPTNMNYWFEGIDTLTYVDKIPDSVRTMVKTFNGCDGLKTTADWTGANSLLNINQCYASCTALTEIYPIPGKVRIARNCFYGCSELQKGCEMDKAENLIDLTGMYSNCPKMIQAWLPENAKVITSMFEYDINLKVMPTITPNVKNMKSCFKGCISLAKLNSIPEGVTDLTDCFNGCEMLTGNLEINCNAENFNGIFAGAAIATKVNIKGESKYLDIYAHTSDTKNVYVNNYQPDPNIVTIKDLEMLEQQKLAEQQKQEELKKQQEIEEQQKKKEQEEKEEQEEQEGTTEEQ